MTELVVIRAANDECLAAEIARVAAFLARAPSVSLADVACTCAKMVGPSAISVIAEDVASLHARLVSAHSRIIAGAQRIRDKSGTYYFREHLLGADAGKLAFVYPGVPSFYPDMMRDLAIEQPECRAAFDELEEALAGDSEFTPSSFIFPPAPYYRHDADIFRSGAYAQALVSTYAACSAMTRMLSIAGISPDGVVGFAGGDLAAMMCSGAAGLPSRQDRVRIISDIYRIVYKAVNHGGLMKVVVFSAISRRPGEAESVVAAFPQGEIALAVDFSPRQKTYIVSEDRAQEVLDAFAAAGVRTVVLALDRPFNTPLCSDLVPAVRKFADRWMKRESICDVYSCASAERLPRGVRHARKDTAKRWARTVRFEETVRKMYEDGYRVFLEVGPRGLMTAAVSDTLRDMQHAAIPLNSIHRSGSLQMRHALGQLAALGANLDTAPFLVRSKAKCLDFDAALPPEERRDSEMRLSRAFPRLTLLTPGDSLIGQVQSGELGEPKARGAKAAQRAAAVAQLARRRRQFDFGALNPLVSDADLVSSSPGVSVEITKVFRLSELPFIGDFAFGTSQMSYSDPNLKGLIPLAISVGVEIMAETALLVAPNRYLVRIENLVSRRMLSFETGELKLYVKAERVAHGQSDEIAVKVQIRDDSPNAAYTWPAMEATAVFAARMASVGTSLPEPLERPRSVHWSGRDIYPSRLCCGSRLRGVRFVETWSESGLDYEIVVPPLAGNVAFTRFPLWSVNPLLLEIALSGFAVWRSHERFQGAASFPFRMRRLSIKGFSPKEDAKLKCYMRLTGVTPESQLCDISVTDGNGREIMEVSGWEEQIERVPTEYRDLVLQPATTFITSPLDPQAFGDPGTDFSSALVADVPYALFARNEERWLRMLSYVVLGADERRDFAEMSGSAARRTEWLFGRIAAKEAVRRFLRQFHQARWSDADVRVWPDGSGKPHALGAWNDYLSERLDIAIAHTDQFVIAVAAANARVGVDVESLSRDISEEFAKGVFVAEELDLAASAADASHAAVKFWCAKEAVSKALGTGIRYSPKEMKITGFIADTGTVTVRLEGAWSSAFPAFRGRDIPVTIKTVREHALASCFIPSTLFSDEI